MKNFTWKKLAEMKDQLIGKELRTGEREYSYRAKIKKVSMDDTCICVTPAWVERSRTGYIWSPFETHSLFANFEHAGAPSYENETIYFRIPGIGGASISLSETPVKKLYQPGVSDEPEEEYDRDRDAHC